MSYPVNYAYFPANGSPTWEILWNRHKSIEYAWREGVKGVPVPFTGGKQWRKAEDEERVSQSYRRAIDSQWLSDWLDEGYDCEEGFSVSDWFGASDLVWDWYEDDTECSYCNGPCEL